VIIFQISVAMFLVMALGFVARRKGYFSAETTRTISLFVVDVAFPSLVFVSFLRTIDAATLRQQWYLPVFGFGLILLGHLVGLVLAPLFVARPKRGTFWFLTGMSNWVYLPLPIVEALYGDEGIQAILLFNIGGQVVLWTVLVGGLRGGRPNAETLKNLALNPGLLATAAGILLALLFPQLGNALDAQTAAATPGQLLVKACLQPLEMVGNVTIPISLIVIGAQLAGLASSAGGAGSVRLFPPDRAVIGTILARLGIAPVLYVLIMQGLLSLGLKLPPDLLTITYIIAAMPSAVSCGILVERFGGDTALAARGVLYTTAVALLSVPGFIALLQLLGIVAEKV
jgi:predicted permease